MDAPAFLTSQLLVSLLVITVVIHLVLGLAGFSTYLERKISAYIQDRIGPNRVGFDLGLPFLSFLKGLWGLGQPLADGIKFILKEDYCPKHADKALFTLAPIIVVIPALIGFAVIPWGGQIDIPQWTVPFLKWTVAAQTVTVAAASINIGVIYLLAVGSLSIYGITLAGWASNNKYSFLGALRSSAQMISYEIPMGLSILTVLLITGSLLPERIIAYQAQHGWLLLSQPLAGIIFFICILAECNRTPFDNAECEQELVGGYHTEYGAMRWALFFLAEYSHMITASAFFAVLFLGGYHLPLGLSAGNTHILSPENHTVLGAILKFHVMLGKVMGIIFLMMLVRWTIPRLKFDQVLSVNWQGLIPLSILLVVINAVLVHLELTGLPQTLAANLAVALVVLAILPFLPRATSNHKVRIAGSRFFPLLGEGIITSPTDPRAREDRPIQGSALR